MQTGCIILAVIFFYASATSVADARPLAVDACQSQCSIEYGADQTPALFCSCQKLPRTVVHSAASAFPPNFAHSAALQRSRLFGQDEASVAQVASNSCQAKVDQYRNHARSAESIKQFLDNASPSLCECVAQRVHYPVARSCRRTLANEQTCTFAASLSSGAHSPLRNPTLEDYQSCLITRSIHPLPTVITCAAAACTAPPVCTAGQELVNLASSDACCPKYSCIDTTHGIPQPDQHGTSSAQ